MQYQFGDVYFVQPASPERGMYTSTTALRPGRPGIIVSSPTGINRYQLMVVFCTTKIKPETDCIFTTVIRGKTCAVLCNEIQTIDISQLGDYIMHLSPDVTMKLSQCLFNSIGDGTEGNARAQIYAIKRILRSNPDRYTPTHKTPYYTYPRTSAPPLENPDEVPDDDDYDE